jgi:hypothetical protein
MLLLVLQCKYQSNATHRSGLDDVNIQLYITQGCRSTAYILAIDVSFGGGAVTN